MQHPGDQPHRRLNPLTGEWVLVSAHRTERPWLGQEESVSPRKGLSHDPECYLCPAGKRVSGAVNPEYSGTYVFTNDFPALLPHQGGSPGDRDGLFQWEAAAGTSRVICYSPRHDLSLADLSENELLAVISTWRSQAEELSHDHDWVQIFENKGAAMGASNPHPHGQIWAGDYIPTELAKEDRHQQTYFKENQSVLLMDYAHQELAQAERVICKNDRWVILVPYWATWPFETLLLPLEPLHRMQEMSHDQAKGLARILDEFLPLYDKLFQVSFPYSFGWHGAPMSAAEPQAWQLHAHFYPPLLRSASVRKFLVGYEMLAEAQRDLTPEQAAHRIRACAT